MEITITIKIDEQELSKTKGGENGSRVVSQYARIFTRGNPNYSIKDPEFNMQFLKSVQKWANDKLQSKTNDGTRNHLYLNEVYAMLGLPQLKEFKHVGWIYDEKNPIGDNFVDFGIPCRDAVKKCDGILLDFNVDGCISDQLLKFEES